jgi:hypothetical protein
VAAARRASARLLDLGVQRALGLEVLEDRLDHQVGIGHAVALDVGAQPRGRLGALVPGP